MNAADIIRLAYIASAGVRRQMGYALTADDNEEWHATAIVGIVEAIHNQPHQSPGWYVVAGRHAIWHMLRRQWMQPPATSLREWHQGEFAVRPDRWEPDEDQQAALSAALARLRTQHGARNRAAQQRDIAILLYLCKGWRDKEIGEALGLPARHIMKYRQTLVRRLRSIQETQQ